MQMCDQDVLDAATWLDRMQRLAEGLGSPDAGPDRHIRKAYYLAALAPDAFKNAMPAPMDEMRLEAMLERGDYDGAVSALTGASAGAGGGDRREPDAQDDPCGVAIQMMALGNWASQFTALRPPLH